MTTSAPPSSLARRRASVLALTAALVVGLSTTACSSGGSAAPTAETVVKPPPLTLQGCTYVINGKVPVGEPAGIQPPFPAFSSTQAATDALTSIKEHGGTGLVDGFTVPSGTELYAGPETSSAPIGTIEASRSLLLADPVLWTSRSGQRWLATFIACGGPNLYWIDVAQIAKADSAVGAQISNTVAELVKAPSFITTGRASALPITIDAHRQFAWVSPAIPFAIGRGQYLGF